MPARRRALALVLPVALILGLGACSSDDGAPATPPAAPTSEAPSVTPTAEPSETPEPEPTETGPTPPPRPAAMDDTGKKGAQAAAARFFDLLNYGFESGDSKPMQEMRFSEMCVSCEAFTNRVDTYAEESYSVNGSAGELSEFEVSDRDTLTGGYAVFAQFESDEMVVSGPGGDHVETFERDHGYVQIDVVHDGDAWKIMSIVSDQDRAE